jgi:hypothetical protein
MALVCSICAHPLRDHINRDILARAATRAVARKYDVGKSAVHRHKSKCLRDAVIAAVHERDKEVEQLARDLVDDLRDAMFERIVSAYNNDAPDVQRAHLASVRQKIETVAKAAGWWSE